MSNELENTEINRGTRLDVQLTQTGMYETRQKSVFAIKAGAILVNGKTITKTSFPVSETDKIEIVAPGLKYVSLGGLKMEKALKSFHLNVKGMRVIDIGASTGGFSDCLLQNDAAKILCLDVGSDQLHQKLRNDSRISYFENVDVRFFESLPHEFTEPDLIVVDVSFISVKQFIPTIKKLCSAKTRLIVLIKPQFELSEKVKMKNGILLNEPLRKKLVSGVVEEFKLNSFELIAKVETDVEHKKKNIEELAYFRLKSYQ